MLANKHNGWYKQQSNKQITWCRSSYDNIPFQKPNNQASLRSSWLVGCSNKWGSIKEDTNNYNMRKNWKFFFLNSESQKILLISDFAYWKSKRLHLLHIDYHSATYSQSFLSKFEIQSSTYSQYSYTTINPTTTYISSKQIILSQSLDIRTRLQLPTSF